MKDYKKQLQFSARLEFDDPGIISDQEITGFTQTLLTKNNYNFQLQFSSRFFNAKKKSCSRLY